MKVNQGNKIAAQAQVPGTPYMVVNGKYLLSGRMAGSNEGMLKVADYLLSKEQNERTFIGDQSSPIFSGTLADK
jgi:thiol:disulfide interchange protein DsbA